MNHPLTEYTFTFDGSDEKLFNRILARLDPDEYEVVVAARKVEDTLDGWSMHQLETVINMEPEAAAMFRFGMKTLSIKRKRTPEEIAEADAAKAKAAEISDIFKSIFGDTKVIMVPPGGSFEINIGLPDDTKS